LEERSTLDEAVTLDDLIALELDTAEDVDRSPEEVLLVITIAGNDEELVEDARTELETGDVDEVIACGDDHVAAELLEISDNDDWGVEDAVDLVLDSRGDEVARVELEADVNTSSATLETLDGSLKVVVAAVVLLEAGGFELEIEVDSNGTILETLDSPLEVVALEEVWLEAARVGLEVEADCSGIILETLDGPLEVLVRRIVSFEVEVALLIEDIALEKKLVTLCVKLVVESPSSPTALSPLVTTIEFATSCHSTALTFAVIRHGNGLVCLLSSSLFLFPTKP
jgi:hypothetical protein